MASQHSRRSLRQHSGRPALRAAYDKDVRLHHALARVCQGLASAHQSVSGLETRNTTQFGVMERELFHARKDFWMYNEWCRHMVKRDFWCVGLGVSCCSDRKSVV